MYVCHPRSVDFYSVDFFEVDHAQCNSQPRSVQPISVIVLSGSKIIKKKLVIFPTKQKISLNICYLQYTYITYVFILTRNIFFSYSLRYCKKWQLDMMLWGKSKLAYVWALSTSFLSAFLHSLCLINKELFSTSWPFVYIAL